MTHILIKATGQVVDVSESTAGDMIRAGHAERVGAPVLAPVQQWTYSESGESESADDFEE